MYCSLHRRDKIIGIFDDINLCKDFLKGLEKNNMINNSEKFSIKIFTKNTINLFAEYKYNFLKNDFTDNVSKKKNTKKLLSKEESNKIYEKRKKLDIKKHKLDIHKDKIQSSKDAYAIDIKLYEEFKKKENDKNFEIPELFIAKYNLFKKLETKDKLSWENFILEYVTPKVKTSYERLF